MRNKWFLSLSVLSLLAVYDAQAARDPFAPFVGGNVGGSDAIAMAAPQALTQDPVTSYRVIGVLVSGHGSIAVVQNRTRQNYFVHTGEKFGREGGIVSTITIDGVKVKIGEQETLYVVSNPVEATNEAAKPTK